MKVTRNELDLINSIKYEKNGIVGVCTRRYISSNITRIVSKTNIKPNQITFFSLLVALIGCGFIATAQPVNLIFGGILIFCSKILDGVDGEIARLKQMETAKGAWLDGISDRFKENILLLSITHASFIQTGEIVIWLYGFIAGIGLHMIAIVLEHTGKMNKEVLKSTHDSFWLIRFLNTFGFRKQFIALQADTYLFIIYILVIFNQLRFLIILLGFLFNFYWLAITILVYLRKWKNGI